MNNMEIQKAAITVDGDNITMDVPFMKVDVEHRIVHGFATLDNVDSQGDIVTQEASIKAFKNFRGNIREMHQPKAVGKLVSYRPDVFVDRSTGETHQGVYVSAYVSKGAQDTWEKVLDGTLSGFSIGGVQKKAEPIFHEKSDSIYKQIKEYVLVELSLVDNPANKLANILMIQKSDDFSVKIEKNAVHWCDNDGILSVDNQEQSKCPACNKAMQSIGFIEEEPNKDMLKGILLKFKDESGGVINPSDDSEETVDSLAKSTENPIQEDTMAEEQEPLTVEEEVAKSDSPEEGEADLVVKAVDSVNEFTEAVAGLSTLVETVKSLSEVVADLKKSIDNVNEKVTQVDSKVAEVQGSVTKVDERIEAVEADTAIKKSGDVGGITESPRIEKSIWGGRFLSSTALYR